MNVEYRGHTIRIEQDEYPDSPRNWDNLGTMVCWHSRYQLGDVQPTVAPGDWLEDFRAENPDPIMVPLYLYDHSGITMRTRPFDCRWDSGQVGWIFITLEKVREEYGWKRVTQARRDKIEEYLRQEVKTYDQYLTGDVWGYVIEGEDDVDLDSCWGFYGQEDAIEQAKEQIDWHLREDQAA